MIETFPIADQVFQVKKRFFETFHLILKVKFSTTSQKVTLLRKISGQIIGVKNLNHRQLGTEITFSKISIF